MFRRNYVRAPILWMDTGAFAGDATMAGRFQTETLIEGMNRLGFVAANITDKELAIGVEEFRTMATRAEFAMISTSIVYQDDATPVFQPYLKQSFSWRGRKPVRVAILGITQENPGFLGRSKDGRRVVLASPVQALTARVPTLRDDVDLVVLLANATPQHVERILREVPGIDIVLGGWAGQISSVVGTPPQATVVYGGDQGKRVGELRLFFGSQGLLQTTVTHLFLDSRYPYDPAMKEFEDQANIKINDYYREVAQVTKPEDTDVRAAERYVGSSACGTCHEKEQKIWAASGHAHAMQALVDAQLEYSPLCVGCHVTGDRKPSGFVNNLATPSLANVQCEACHGPAGAHLEDPSRPYGRTDSSGCLVCHTGENSPDFDFASYWEKIGH